MRKNVFSGCKYYVRYAKIVYKQLMARKTVTYESVVKEYLGDKYDPQKFTLTKEEGYRELKKAFPDVCKAIKEAAGEHSIEKSGRNRCKEESGRRGYRYVGTDEDPLKDMVNARAIKNLKKCEKPLMSVYSKLYGYIKNQRVLSITYIPRFEDDKREQLVFHPHYLREFNGRWFLFGHAERREPENGYNLAVDRIENVSKKYGKWCGAPEGFYEDYFRDIVGVTHDEKNQKNPEPCHVFLRAHSKYMFGLVKTCPLHHSQKIVTDFGEHDGKEYGEFELYVEQNKELIGRILQKGGKLEVISPLYVREMVKKEVQEIMRRYES